MSCSEIKKLNIEAKNSIQKRNIVTDLKRSFSQAGHKMKNVFHSITKFFNDIYESMVFVVVSCALIPIILAIVIMILCKINYCKKFKFLKNKKSKDNKNKREK